MSLKKLLKLQNTLNYSFTFHIHSDYQIKIRIYRLKIIICQRKLTLCWHHKIFDVKEPPSAVRFRSSGGRGRLAAHIWHPAPDHDYDRISRPKPAIITRLMCWITKLLSMSRWIFLYCGKNWQKSAAIMSRCIVCRYGRLCG